MSTVVQPLFADSDANLLALGAIAFVGLLVWEIIREWRKKRKGRLDRISRERSRKSHWGFS
jgi:hypothetical protein